jgi:hypothetical protein
MRNIFFRFFLILFLSALLQPAVAQENEMVGAWHVDLAETLLLMEGSFKLKYDSLSDELKSRANNSMADKEFTFNANGEFTSKWSARGVEKISSGSWTLDTVTSVIKIVINEQPTEYDLEIKSSGRIILRSKTARGFFNNLYLARTP